MKILIGVARIFVGILFMISGFVKMNDPIGFSFKLTEYFGADVLNLEFLIPYALLIAVLLVIFEFMLGVMLILGYVKNFTRWCLLLMIVFFTFLTFYSAYFDKVTDCGCFGDALPLTPWQSFGKDVVLLVLILILFFNRKYLRPLVNPASHKWIVFVLFIGSLGFSYYVLMHLPLIDFRPYNVGANIEENMMSDKDNPIPPIHDFGFYGKEGDATDEILNENHVLVIVAYDLSKAEKRGWSAIEKAISRAREHEYKVIGLSASGPDAIKELKKVYGVSIDFYACDETAIKTMIRSNPGLMTLHHGTITQKLHWNDADELQLSK